MRRAPKTSRAIASREKRGRIGYLHPIHGCRAAIVPLQSALSAERRFVPTVGRGRERRIVQGGIFSDHVWSLVEY